MCLSSDSTGAYVHDLSLASCGCDSSPVTEEVEVPSAGDWDEESSVHSVDLLRDGESAGSGMGRPGSVPFVSHRLGAYGRLLLAVYVRWKMGLLVASDWLRPVTRGVGLAGGSASHSAECGRRQLTRTQPI